MTSSLTGSTTNRRPSDRLDEAGGRQFADRVLRIGAVVAVATPIIAALVVAWKNGWYPTTDQAVLELQSLDVPRHLPMYGAYSRDGFHHPGPAEFVLLALPVRVLGPLGMLAGAALINLVAVAGTVLVLFRRGGRVLMAGGVVTVLVVERAFASELLDPWNTWIPVLPFALALVLAWSVWCRDWWALPVLGVVVSFAVQAHVGYSLLAVWLVGSALVAVVLSHRHAARAAGEPCPRGVIVTFSAVVVAAWVVPLLGQLRQSPGNLSLIVGYFRHSTDPPVGFGRALTLLAREIGLTPPWLGGAEPVEGFTGATEGQSPLLLVPLVAVVAVTMALAWRAAATREADDDRRARDAFRFQAVLVGATVIGFVSVARITGEPFPYLFRWLWVIGALLWLSSLWSAWVVWTGGRATSRPGADAADPWAPRLPTALAAAAVLVLTVWSSVGTVAAPLPYPQYAAAVSSLIDPTAAAIGGVGDVLVVGEGTSWHEVQAGLTAELERRGFPVYVDDGDAFTYGAHRTIGDRAVGARLVVAVGEAVTARQQAGATPIASFDPLTPAERAELGAIRQRYLDQLAARSRNQAPSDPVTEADSARADELNRRGDVVAVYLDRP